MISFVPLIGSPSFYTSSVDVMKQILAEEMKLNSEKPYDLTLARYVARVVQFVLILTLLFKAFWR